MSRSLKKGLYFDISLLKKVNNFSQKGSKKSIKTWSRNSTIISDFVGYTFLVHNGRKHIPVFITQDMVGHKLGEFSPTRSFSNHPKSLKKVNKS